jgi:beta-lactamase superfamily II metal-dependent hydrolase
MPLRIAVIVLALLLSAGQPATSSAQQREDILDTNFVVRFLDAGDGEAVWLTVPNVVKEQRSNVLIDCGPPSFGGKLALLLQTAGVPQLDALILSGATDERIGGCADLLQQIPIREIRWTGQRGSTPVWTSFESLVQAQGWMPIRLATEDVIYWGDVRATVLNPPVLTELTADPDKSLAMEIDFGRWGMLLAGDTHRSAEGQIQALLQSNPSAIQVLKVADHGSAKASSFDFLDTVFASSVPGVTRTAIVANGNNTFSLQIEDAVLRNLQAVHATVLNTAVHGTITVVVHPELGPQVVPER